MCRWIYASTTASLRQHAVILGNPNNLYMATIQGRWTQCSYQTSPLKNVMIAVVSHPHSLLVRPKTMTHNYSCCNSLSIAYKGRIGIWQFIDWQLFHPFIKESILKDLCQWKHTCLILRKFACLKIRYYPSALSPWALLVTGLYPQSILQSEVSVCMYPLLFAKCMIM